MKQAEIDPVAHLFIVKALELTSRQCLQGKVAGLLEQTTTFLGHSAFQLVNLIGPPHQSYAWIGK